jgi:hypothetical protein
VTLLVSVTRSVEDESILVGIVNHRIAYQELVNVLYKQGSRPKEIDDDVTLLAKMRKVWEDILPEVVTLSLHITRVGWSDNYTNLALVN